MNKGSMNRAGQLIYLPFAALITLSALFLFAGSGVYLLEQAGPLFGYTFSAVPAERVLSGDFPTAARELVQRAGDIRAFAREELGLAIGNSYTGYVDVAQDYLVAVVQASAPLSLEPYLFRYPFFGRAPYRGYYDPADARRTASRLEREGYDVLVREVDAFSTLGLLPDPLYSFMADYPAHRLASTLLHEAVHNTMFDPAHIEFSEQLATFVDRHGSLAYLERRYGRDSEELRTARARLRDRATFAAAMRELHRELERLYESELAPERMRAAKRETIHKHQQRFLEAYDERFRTDAFRWFGTAEITNAHVLLYAQYTGDLDAFEKLLEGNDGDLRRTLGVLREVLRAPGDPFRSLREAVGP